MIKKLLSSFVALMICATSSAYAAKPPLKVAVPIFSPPFVMQSTDKHLYGFDIVTVEYVCNTLERRCEYYPMHTEALLSAVANQVVDVAIGGLILTLKRASTMHFSVPYLASNAQFMSTSAHDFPKEITLKDLGDLRIGVLNGSALERNVRSLNVTPEPKIVEFDRNSQIITALENNRIELALLSAPQVDYWTSNSSGLFKAVGEPFPIGYGFVIAVNTDNNPGLIREIDDALLEYRNSEAFRSNYYVYFHQKM